MTLQELNQLPRKDLETALAKCCGAEAWYHTLAQFQPFPSVEWLHQISDLVWEALADTDYLEAFTHHPMIGDMAALKAKFASTAHWAGNEQQGSQQANEATLLALKQGNEAYLKKFGFIFIVCATGKSADEMLALLNQRMPNDAATELKIAAAEQNKITHLRLDKLLSD
ncbi:2-oxo-4-hydroxy-4-carboxy-5-ureidoimidazoline decarboxylase [Marinicella litoralis]|uniref:2-oxo-4-hydroxy-4-carboxy-5-ureidoimidazoline decarboxylase n=1 Tax=Marinicella litoralis TaxID=644220 RepID=A0A4R6XM56_9GAMM|nr:2-oxo-4-hydroxy-4-carboxy-5-ureidoimidazoline decarboxylase [Marinicella litoralis]TDR20666.1 2-oxo-4-hydroxy-4-carboxy-5-ureidoimidazoline decarboxylase [Marinicella litoralis]